MKVGIDLGTTFSAVARIDAATGRAAVIPNIAGKAITPSVVAIAGDGSVVIGEEAKEMQECGYTEVASFFKRCMGMDNFRLRLGGREYSAVDLSALLLHGLVREAEQVSGERIDGVVITVPAYFGSRERDATFAAGKQAGLNVLTIINEPSAAAYAYGLNDSGRGQTILIYDLGGGTFDVTVAHIGADAITIKCSDGDHSLGGRDWDEAISRWAADRFREQFDLDPLEDEEQLSRIAVAAENAKIRLSSADYTDLTVQYAGHKGTYRLTRALFAEISSFMLGQTSRIIERMFASAGLSWRDIDGVILVGGSTRMPMVRDYVVEKLGKPPLAGVNVDEAVALGAAIRANMEPQRRTLGGAAFAGGRRAALGARTLNEATAHALGMISETADREKYVNDILIPIHSPVPAAKTVRRQLRVGRKGGEMEVYLVQGSAERPLDNEIAGRYVFTGIPAGSGGKTLLDVTYEYDAENRIHISARVAGEKRALHCRTEPIPADMSWTDLSPRDRKDGAPTQHAEVILITDLSGSMSGTPLDEAKKAMLRFVRESDLDTISVGVMGVADSVKEYLKPTGRRADAERAINEMRIGDCGGCNAAHPFNQLRGAYSQKADVRFAIVLADGIWEDQAAATAAAKRCHAEGIEIVGMGFGYADEAFIRSISSRSDMAVLTDLSRLGESFSKIAQIVGSGEGLSRR